MTNEPNETGTRSDAPESEEKKVRKWDFVNKQWAATIIFSGVVLYGIEVAKLAGLPGTVTRRAHEVLRALEASAPKNNVEIGRAHV